MLIKLQNNIDEISRLCDEIKFFCQKHSIPDDKYHDIILIMDEMVTNVIKYGFPEGGEHELFIHIKIINEKIHILISDTGVEFDPLAKNAPDTELDIDEREIGGLGIYIVKQLSKNVLYERKNGQNHLIIHVSKEKHEPKPEE